MEQTDSCQREEGRRNWEKECEGLVKEYIFMTHGHGQWSGAGLAGQWGLGRGGQRGKNGGSYNTINNKK